MKHIALIILLSIGFASCSDDSIEGSCGCTMEGEVKTSKGDREFIKAPVKCGTKQGTYKLERDVISIETEDQSGITFEKGVTVKVKCN